MKQRKLILVIIAFVLVTALIATALYFQRDSDDQNSNGSSNQSEQGTSEESQDENSGVTVEPNIITVEARGIWFDPIYTANTPEDIIKAIDMIADAGFNQVYLAVTTGEGYAQYRSGVLPMLDKHQGFDPAKVAIEQAHKRGMEVHAHMLTLANPQQIYAHPEWDQQRFNKNAKIAVLGGGGNHEQLTAPVWNHVIDIVRENNAHGTVVFDYYVMGHLTEDPENFIALKNGAYKEPAKELSQ